MSVHAPVYSALHCVTSLKFECADQEPCNQPSAHHICTLWEIKIQGENVRNGRIWPYGEISLPKSGGISLGFANFLISFTADLPDVPQIAVQMEGSNKMSAHYLTLSSNALHFLKTTASSVGQYQGMRRETKRKNYPNLAFSGGHA